MIVLDENLNDHRIVSAISAWFSGQVILITKLRTESQIKDDAIPALLHHTNQPIFVTINVKDFWKKKKAFPHQGYCIINVDVPEERIHDVPKFLRRLFRLPDFKTKALRMGKIIRLTQNGIEYYERDRRIHSLQWPD